jgi:hypothetical protein
MINTDNWDYYYNYENGQTIRANLVYTPLVSPDRTKFCMWFKRDVNYHFDQKINSLWTEDILDDRFQKELKYHNIASRYVPTLEILEINYSSKKIIIEWFDNDFHTSCQNKSREEIFPNWEYQMINMMKKLWKNNVVKLSLHPNSWIVKDEYLVPFNWFFCYDKSTDSDSLDNLIIQISETRLEKVYDIFKSLGFDPNLKYSATELQTLALHSFKSNYNEDIINRLLVSLNETINKN